VFVVGRQLKVLQTGTTSFVICTFSDGRTLTLSFDHIQAMKQEFNSRLDFIARNELEQRSDESAFGDYQILQIGTIEPSL